jgi:hypothetical protein
MEDPGAMEVLPSSLIMKEKILKILNNSELAHSK